MTVTSCVIAANKIFVFIELVFLINEDFALKHILSWEIVLSQIVLILYKSLQRWVFLGTGVFNR